MLMKKDLTIRSNVKLIMKLRHRKVLELATATALDEFTLKKARADETIGSCRLGSLYKIAVALNVDLEDLFEIVGFTRECSKAK
jgi:DNA-binding Xre family transcriptional regulator